MLALARELTPPSFAAYVVVGAHTAMRPGELDGLRNEYLDFQKREIRIEWQWNAKARAFTRPKHEHRRTVAMTPPALRGAALAAAGVGVRVHDAARARTTPRARASTTGTASAAPPGSGTSRCTPARATSSAGTRSTSCGSTRTTSPPQLGHRDGGALVRSLYGHPDAVIARERIQAAYEDAPTAPVPLRAAS